MRRKGTILRASVTGLGDAELPVKIDMLKKIDHVSLAAGENDGTDFDHIRVTTTDDETAKQLKSIADGIKAMIDLRLDNEPDLKKTVDATKIEQNDKTVSIDWSGSSDSVIQMMDRAATRSSSAFGNAAARRAANPQSRRTQEGPRANSRPARQSRRRQERLRQEGCEQVS